MAPVNQTRVPSGHEKNHPVAWEKYLSSAVAVAIFFLVGLLVIRNEPFADPNLVVLLRIVLSVAVGVLGATIPGLLGLTWSGGGVAVRAGGAVGLVVLSYVCSPAVIQGPTVTPTERITISITNVPLAGDDPDSRGDIAGRVKGLAKPEGYNLVIYAHTDQWYVQPLINESHTDIAADGQWSNWTHLGHRYAVLVVSPGFRPSAKTQTLPQVGGDVIAKAEVAAKVKQ